MRYVCKQCGNDFEGQAPSERIKPRVFCSRRCKGLAMRSPNSLGEHQGKSIYIGKDGYVRIVLAWGKERLFHVFLKEQELGVSLKGKVVHHKNGNKRDNRLENLEVIPGHVAHVRLHAAERIRAHGGDISTHKICGCCKRVLLRTEFPKAPSARDGLFGYCWDYTREKRRRIAREAKRKRWEKRGWL